MPVHRNHTAQRFKSPTTRRSFPEEMMALLEGQKKSWKLLADGYASLASVRQREVACNGFNVTLQYNPGRMTSTAAPVDAESIKRRSCFLCVENLPQEQEGLLYDEDFLILCNPAPIFSRHFTVSHLRHRAQALDPLLPQLLLMAKDLGPTFSLFYNGPQCGASAPDHMHLQASPLGLIPVELEAQQSVRRMVVASFERAQILTLKDFGRETIIVEGSDPQQIGKILKKILTALKTAINTTGEPMVNVICSFSAPLWRVILFPRAKHRPDAFFRDDDSRILVSPAAVDMGGLIITPSEKDFIRLDRKILESIYAEVSLDTQTVRRALEDLS